MVPTASRSSSSVFVADGEVNLRMDGMDAATTSVGPVVEWLTRLGAEHAQWFVSCYLKLEPRDRSRGKYLIKLKNRVRERLEWLDERGVDRAVRETVERDLRRVREYLEHPGNLPPGRGIAVFAAEPLELFAALPLPRVLRSRLAVDRTPLVRELAALDDEFGMVLCTVYDRTSARFFKVSAFGAEELTGLPAGDTTRAGRFHGGRTAHSAGAGLAGAGEHNFNQRIQEEKHRHYAQIAQRLFDLARGNSVRGIVLAGTGADADAVRPHLHPYLARQVLGATRLNPKSASPAEVMESVLAVRRTMEREWEAKYIEELREARGRGWAVSGVEASLRALSHGQVRTLLVDPTAERSGFRCSTSGRLTSVRDACDGEGAPDAVPDVIDDAIEDTLRLGGHVEVVEDETGRSDVDGLAALLRFRAR